MIYLITDEGEADQDLEVNADFPIILKNLWNQPMHEPF